MQTFRLEQPQNLRQDELDQLSLGINRVRFLKNRISVKNIPLFQAVQSTRIIDDRMLQQRNSFIVPLNRNPMRRPLTELRQIREKKSPNPQITAAELKTLKQNWNLESEKNKSSEKVHKMFQHRSVKKGKEKSKIRINNFHQTKREKIINSKEKLMRSQLLQGQKNIKKYEQLILIGQKIKEFMESKKEAKYNGRGHRMVSDEVVHDNS